jgi:hypothetical protein
MNIRDHELAAEAKLIQAEDGDTYGTIILAALIASKMISLYDLPDLLSRMSLAHTTASIYDPTLWMNKHKMMEEDRELIEAAMPLWRMAMKMRDRMKEVVV